MVAVLNSVSPDAQAFSFVIDAEVPSDYTAREALLDNAMGEGRHRKSSEKLRHGRMPADGLALVARGDNGCVIGTVRLWNIQAGVDNCGAPIPALLLGPLAVSAEHSGRGIGGALMRTAVSVARERGHGAILLVGDQAYYERFGFTAQQTQNLVMPGPYERERFLALELKDNWLNSSAGVLVANGYMYS